MRETKLASRTGKIKLKKGTLLFLHMEGPSSVGTYKATLKTA